MADKDKNDLQWLLKMLSFGFDEMYNIQLLVPNMIGLQHGEVKSWFQQQRYNGIQSFNEEICKLTNIIQYYKNVIEKNKRLELGQLVYRKVDVETFLTIFQDVSLYQDFINSITKIFDIFSQEVFYQFQQNLHLQYEICYSKDSNKDIGKTEVFVRNFNAPFIQKIDYQKNYQSQQNAQPQLPKQQVQKEAIKVISSQITSKCIKLNDSFVHLLENKMKQKIAQMKLEVVITQSNQLWIIGASDIKIHKDGQIDGIDRNSIPSPGKIPKPKQLKCQGIYCDYQQFFADDNNEDSNIYFMNQKNKHNKQSILVNKKSIVLDQIERAQTIERIKKLMDFNDAQIKQLGEYVIFKCRKFFDISDIQKTELKSYRKINNLYQNLILCQHCEYFYQNIDYLRMQRYSQPISDQKVISHINQYFDLCKVGKLNDKSAFSQEFFDKIKNIETPSSTKSSIIKESYFENKNIKSFRKKFNLAQQDDLDQESVPIVYAYTYRSLPENEVFKTRYKVKQDELGRLGNRHLTGSIQDQFYLTKSSLKINKINQANIFNLRIYLKFTKKLSIISTQKRGSLKMQQLSETKNQTKRGSMTHEKDMFIQEHNEMFLSILKQSQNKRSQSKQII